MTSGKVKEAAHKGAGWTGVALALVTLATVYLERDAAKQQAASAAAHAQVGAVDAVGADLDELSEAIAVGQVLLEEREKEIDRLRERVEELERRHRIRTDRATPAARHVEIDADSDPHPPAPKAMLDQLRKRVKSRGGNKKERYENAQQQILDEAFEK